MAKEAAGSRETRAPAEARRLKRVKAAVQILETLGLAGIIALGADWIGSWNFPQVVTFALGLLILSTLSLSYVIRIRAGG